MKKYLMAGMSALALCSTFMSCSHDDIVTHSGKINVVETYERAFIERFGPVSPEQDWGFGKATRGTTRAVDTWSQNHTDSWESGLNFELPLKPDPVDVTKPNFRKDATVYYIPEGYSGALDLNSLGLNEGSSLYNFGTITSINNVNYNGKITIYNAGTIENFAPSSGGRHTVYNTGTLKVIGYANIGNLYNSGILVLEREHNPYWPNEGAKADIPNEMSIYSIEPGVITMPDGADFKAACDVHNMMYATGYLKIQNGETQYVCGLEVDGTLDMTQGNLQTSYIKANEITFDGSHIWLLPQAHIVADKISMTNSASEIYGYGGSHALIEAKDWYFRNHNNFMDTFSNNIYFKIDGSIDIEERVDRDNGNGGTQTNNETNKYATAADYIASQNGKGLAERINQDVSGKPECGLPYGEIPEEKPSNNPAVRIIAEDLTVSERGDFDFNDVVFDVEWLDEEGNTALITLQAAGGTLPMKVGGDGEEYEVHKRFGLSNTNQMINTGTGMSVTLDPVEFTITGSFGGDANKIPVKVYKLGEWIELEAIQGKAPKKIAITRNPKLFDWCNEREPIEDRYKNFVDWVGDPSVVWY